MKLQVGSPVLELRAEHLTSLGNVTAYTLDAYNHRVLAYTAGAYEVAAVVYHSGNAAHNESLAEQRALMSNGQAPLRDLVMPSPLAGRYILRLSATGLGTVEATVWVTEGVPARLAFFTEPSRLTDNKQALPRPRLLARGKAGAGHLGDV